MGVWKHILPIGEEIVERLSKRGQFDLPKEGETHGISKIPLRKDLAAHTRTTQKSNRPLAQTKPMTPEEAVKMEARFLSTPGDRSRAGEFLTGLGGVPFKKKVYLGGGHPFALDFPGVGAEDPLAWMSAKHVVEGIDKAAGGAGPGGPLFFGPTVMGERATNYMGAAARAHVEAMRGHSMSKKDLDRYELALRANAPSKENGGIPFSTFKELHTNDDYYEDFLSQPGLGVWRRDLSERADLANVQKAGAADPVAVRMGIMGNEGFQPETGTVGQHLYEINPGGGVVYNPEHAREDYNTGLKMVKGSQPRHLDTGGVQIPADVFFSDYANKMRTEAAAKGKPPPTQQNIIYGIERAKPIQVADQRWLDGISPYVEKYGIKAVIGMGMLTPAQAAEHFGYSGEDDGV